MAVNLSSSQPPVTTFNLPIDIRHLKLTLADFVRMDLTRNPKNPLTNMMALNQIEPKSLMFQQARDVADSLCLGGEKVDAHIEIAEADPHRDFSYAKKCAFKSASKSVSAFEDFKKEYSAKANPSDEDKKHFEYLEYAAEQDIKYRDIFIKKIVKTEGNYYTVDCPTVENLSRRVITEGTADYTVESDSEWRSLTETLAVMISQNPCPEMIQHAKAFAESRSIRFDRVRAHIAIANVDPQHDFSLAEKHAFSILESDTPEGEKEPKSRDVYRRYIAQAKALFDLPAAKVMANTIVDPLDDKEDLYLRFVDIESQTDIEAAKKTRDTNIKNPIMIDYATRYIAINLAKKDLPAGKAMAASITDEYHQKEALSAIAQIEAGQ